jgi:hypothetical protein
MSSSHEEWSDLHIMARFQSFVSMTGTALFSKLRCGQQEIQR